MPLLEKNIINETIICARENISLDPSDRETRILLRGCIIARELRRAVFNCLGFTLSAGVCTSKLMSKLAASYGKPNGQAIIFPEAIPHILENTKVKKARNMGGKIGKVVLDLLPEHEDTMGSIARLLNFNQLTLSLGDDTARMVWNYASGIDQEEVKDTKGALTKSITAFKSFTVRRREDVSKWISLLSIDVLKRVDVDSNRNNRFPTTCTVQYYIRGKNGKRNWNGKSFRVTFPKRTASLERSEMFAKTVEDLLQKNVNVMHIARLGLSAINFQEKAKKSIGSFFSSQISRSELKSAPKKSQYLESELPTHTKASLPEMKQKRIAASSIALKHSQDDSQSDGLAPKPASKKVNCEVEEPLGSKSDDSDLAYAVKLQAKYDREDNILSSTERTKTGKCSNKRKRIDNFFKPQSK